MKQGTITALKRGIEQKLCEKYKDKTLCNQYAWWILQSITGQKQEQLIARAADDLSDEQLKQLDDWMDKLLNKSMPLQYLLGSVPFLDIEILVQAPTLIPRPETEEMTQEVIEQLKQLKNQKINILDIGTGTGSIALALAFALPNATVYAVDNAQVALDLAKQNAGHNKIKNINLLYSDVFNNIPVGLQFDLIISNPPYIAPEEWDALDDSVTQWEDRNALVAQNKGLAIIERIIKQAPKFLKENKEMELLAIPQLIIEIGYQQGATVSRLLENGGFGAITIKKDLEGKDRVVTGRVKNVAIQPAEK